MKATEIELQVQIENRQPLVDFLKAKAEFIAQTHQRDEYYTPAHRDFLAVDPIKEWLRLRDADGKFSINYKNWHYDENNKGLYADEYETPLENIEMARAIFTAIDCQAVIVVDKDRQIWKYADYEISLDTVEGLGDFVEIEYYGPRPATEHATIMQEMITFLKDLGCGSIIRNHIGYPALLLKREAKIERV